MISSKKQLRGVCILHYSMVPVVGGVETTIYHHANFLKKGGFDVHLVSGRGGSPIPDICNHVIPEIDTQHSEIKNMNRALASGELPATFFTLRDHMVRALRPLIASSDVGIVHNAATLHFNLALTAALHILAEEESARLMAWAHDIAWCDPLYRNALHAGYPWDLLRSPWPGVQYVSVSEHGREALASLFEVPKETIWVMPPGVDVGRFLNLQPMTLDIIEHFQLLSAEPMMLLPARIVRRKNIELGIHITASLTKRFPEAILVITGPPDPHDPENKAYLDALMNLRDTLQMKSHVLFLCAELDPDGPVALPPEVVADFYRLADLLLFPSRHEGFGLPLLEAGLARLPVFAVEVPKTELGDGNHIHKIPPENDPSTIARLIASVLEKDRVFSLHRRVLKHFTWTGILKENLMPLLEDLLVDSEILHQRASLFRDLKTKSLSRLGPS